MTMFINNKKILLMSFKKKFLDSVAIDWKH